MLLLRVTKIFNQAKIPYALVGGHAVALHGAVRGTLDIDFITKWTLKNLENIEKALKKINLEPRLPVKAIDLFQFKEEYIKNRNLIAWNFINPLNPSEQVDIIITLDLKNQPIKKVKIKDQQINILAKKALIEMKKASGRKQDLIDIKALEELDD